MNNKYDEMQLQKILAGFLGLKEAEPVQKDWTYVIVFLDDTKKELFGFACPVQEFRFLCDENVKDKYSYCRMTTIMAKERIVYYREYFRDE